MTAWSWATAAAEPPVDRAERCRERELNRRDACPVIVDVERAPGCGNDRTGRVGETAW